jgi:hypothetical protein
MSAYFTYEPSNIFNITHLSSYFTICYKMCQVHQPAGIAVVCRSTNHTRHLGGGLRGQADKQRIGRGSQGKTRRGPQTGAGAGQIRGIADWTRTRPGEYLPPLGLGWAPPPATLRLPAPSVVFRTVSPTLAAGAAGLEPLPTVVSPLPVGSRGAPSGRDSRCNLQAQHPRFCGTPGISCGRPP